MQINQVKVNDIWKILIKLGLIKFPYTNVLNGPYDFKLQKHLFDQISKDMAQRKSLYSFSGLFLVDLGQFYIDKILEADYGC